MESYYVLWTLLGAVWIALHFYFQERYKRKVDSVVHIQGRTEEAETYDFAITHYQDESEGQKREKEAKAWRVIEDRRKFNNDRMERAFKKAQEEMAVLKAAPRTN